MLYCKNCGVSVTGSPDFCPLCQGKLDGMAETGNLFPDIKPKKNHFMTAIKIMIVVTVAAVFSCFAINYFQTDSLVGWWLYVAAGAASFWLPFAIAVQKRGNIAKCIIWATGVICPIELLWDVFTGFGGWSINYVFPITFCTAMAAMAVLARILHLHIEEYIYYLLIDLFFCIAPFVLLLCGALTTFLPTLICMATAAVSVTTLIVFNGKALKAEFLRRNHL